jgi:membrane protein
MAAGIAYWTLFSLFPLVLAGISILGFMHHSSEEQGQLVEGLVKLIPVSEEYLVGVVSEVVHGRGTLGLLAILGLLWSGTAVFSAVRKGINHAWHISQPPYFLWERMVDLVMLLGVALLAFIVVVFTTNVLGLSTAAATPSWLTGGLVGKVLLEVAAVVVTYGVFLLLYRYLPNTTLAWSDVWLGALNGAVLFQGIRIGFTWFVASFGNFNLVYGSLGALMAVLVWAYLSAVALMWGAQVCFTYSRIFGTRAGEGPLPESQPEPDFKMVGDTRRQRGFLGMAITMARWLLPPKRSQP